MLRTLVTAFASCTLFACQSVPLHGSLDDAAAADVVAANALTQDAAAILERHIEATGGRKAYAQDYRISEGTVLHKTLGILCRLTLHESRSTQRRWRSRSEATGDREHGSTGDIAWSYGLMFGAFVMEGEALDQALRTAPLDAPLHWRKNFERAELLPDRTVNGRPAHTLELHLHSGGREIQCFDVETGLHIHTETQGGYMGNLVPLVISYEDYRPVDGLLIPHSVRMAYANFEELIMEFQTVRHVESLPASTFEPPVDVRAILER